MRSVLSHPLLFLPPLDYVGEMPSPPLSQWGSSHAIHVTFRLIRDTVHCRRRKIRCLVAPDDTEGRCENCIRLRKDCQFFPVDQQPPVEKKSRPSSRLETPSAERSVTTPISSSPNNLVPDTSETFYPYPTMAMDTPSAQDMSTYNVGMVQTNMSLTPDRPMGPGDFTGHQPMDPGVAWDEFTTISDPQLLNTMTNGKGPMMNMSPNMWTAGNIPSGLPPPSPISAASPMGNQAQPMAQAPTYAMQPDGSVWQVPPPPPPRTMSYPGQEMGQSYPNQFHPQMPPELKRRMTTPAQSLSAPNAMGAPSSPGASSMTPGSVSYPPGMNYSQWQDMSAMSGMGVVPYPMYAGDAVPQHPYPTNHPMGHPGASGRSPN
ncbi:unnamed protein product [Penicillium salamii]|uniref:Zn(2)-C6 fungal-type domain-containing protein n=1 Tax=Penicillium salamii TaxID=1612424 RepID=A0A9W4JFJ3_9EURO|nr:unnamed protein product [Penicillium salamii]